MRSGVMTLIDCGISMIGVSVLMPVALRVATKPSTGPHADSGKFSTGALTVVGAPDDAPPGVPAEAPGAGLRAIVVLRGVWCDGWTVMVSSSASLCFGGEASGACAAAGVASEEG